MRKLFFLLLISGLLTSCGKNKPDNIIYGRDDKFVGWEPQGPGNPVLEVRDSLYKIQPTWGQANHYARQRGDNAAWVWITVILFAITVFWAVGYFANVSWFPEINGNAWGWIMFALMAGTLASSKWRSASVKWNNDKWVSKSVYEKSISEAGSTQPIWDTLASKCHLNWGPYHCFKK